MKTFAPIFVTLFLLFAVTATANNVILSNISVANNIANTGKVIQFDLTWENSWRTTSTGNLDGVWVFFKVKDNDGTWHHLNFTGTNITMPAGAAFDMGSNGSLIGVGMFIYRLQNGFGTTVANGIKAGIQSYAGTFEVQGYAIEMVYVPIGPFWVGDGSTTAQYRQTYYRDSTTNTPFQINGIGSTIQIGAAPGKLYDALLTQPFTGNLSNFPTGYNPFWLMKYELSQGAYRDFLNTLTYAQQVSRLPSGISPVNSTGTCITCSVTTTRGRIEIKTPGNSTTLTPAIFGCDYDNDNIFDEPNDGEWCSVNGINWPDAAAFLDWSGLRPMTELEYEKSCRGPITPVPEEYAWGNDQIATLPYLLNNAGTTSEITTNSVALSGNAIYQSTCQVIFPNNYSPVNIRGGIFATAVSDRMSSGAGYYGAMELTGNLYELTVSTNCAAGRSYTGKHGDGILNNNGDANENKWPGINGNADINISNTNYNGTIGVTANAGMSDRGGSWGVVNYAIYVSNRNGQIGTSILKSGSMSIRGVRDFN